MDLLILVLALTLCVVASFLYSGAEIGFYSLSRVQVDLEAEHGHRSARRVRGLLGDEPALLITLLIGNNIALQLATFVGEEIARGRELNEAEQVLAVSVLLTPLVFLFGEALPKETFRRRPHHMTYLAAGFIQASRWVYWPLERLLRGLSALLERGFGLGTGRVSYARGRDRLAGYLEEGLKQGALSARAEVLARNALHLRAIPISRVMVPWSEVLSLRSDLSDGELFEKVRDSRWTRLPVEDPDGSFRGYVHQIDVLAGGPGGSVLGQLRPMPALELSTPVDRAILILRGGGHRAAVVGSMDGPEGLVTLKDLVEEISGDLVGL